MAATAGEGHVGGYHTADWDIGKILAAVEDLTTSDTALLAFCSRRTVRRYLAARGNDRESAIEMLRYDSSVGYDSTPRCRFCS
jgi:hypothetical protein